jgi:hypothetical protein
VTDLQIAQTEHEFVWRKSSALLKDVCKTGLALKVQWENTKEKDFPALLDE